MAGKLTEVPLPSMRGIRVGIVCARFHPDLTDRLLAGAKEVLLSHGVGEEDLFILRVPGSFEIPFALRELIQSRGLDGAIALGVILRGDTPHFHYVARSAYDGVLQVSFLTRTPVTSGILTCDTREQAEARCGGKEGNKGAEAARALLELLDQIRPYLKR
jgi:6,7-dimethyl-8-ribityllumazine synthase